MRIHSLVAALVLAGCGGGASNGDATTGPDVQPYASFDAPPCDRTAPADDPTTAARAACMFTAGARVEDSLGVTAAVRAQIPLTHVVIVMQENRSFDHYLGRLSANGQPDAEGFPDTYANPDAAGRPVAPTRLATTCVPRDPPHQWAAMHAQWNNGAMDGFVRAAANATNDGSYALGYYDARDLPFYHWLAATFAMSDRYFAAVLGGTWPNRDYLYCGTSRGVRSTGDAVLTDVRTVFDQLDEAHVAWGVYTDGLPRQDALGWDGRHRGVASVGAFLRGLADGTLPPVAFVDPAGEDDEHPPGDVQLGEAWSRRLYTAAITSPLWPRLAMFFTYDESGGFFDHVPPPPGCPPSPDQAEFDRRGVRVPFTVVSPWARPHYVSHRDHDHTSMLRLIQVLHDLPALTARDANADALLDLFDFGCPQLRAPPPAPAAGAGGCER
jgi:phospholipase C